ncbi:hypothetical protein KSK37_13590 [Kaistella sp. DKR-2]|uniref:hypothetical protein n=1 Tax=Kaistella soli TaxID=2849654 RepID=UPI001C27E569|nr:hypothetical protein [Kaistella soli]MBU8884120.1 hypothetical protein [Kaistella soli]
MARITKNGLLSGILGELVFVNSDSPHVRTRPSQPQQTEKTKAAAKAFGYASAQDKLLRGALERQLSLITDPKYASRHRARLRKALAPIHQNPMNFSLSLPEALVGFDFNVLCLWEKTTAFYPEFSVSEGKVLECAIPVLKAGREIVLPQDAHSAELRLDAFTVNPLGRNMTLDLLGSHHAEISVFSATSPAVWTCEIPHEPAWLVVTGTLLLKSATPNCTAALRGSSTYLFARKV